MKESFIMYNSFYEPIKTLKNEQLGKLLRAIFNYTINNEITQDNDILIPFMFIKNQIDIDANKWEDQKKKRSEAGRLGGIKRAVNENQALSSKSKQCLDMLSNAKQNQANQAVNVNDNVNVNVNVNDNVINKEKNIIKKEKFKKPTLQEISEYCKERDNKIDPKKFYEYYETSNWKDKEGKQVKNWKQKIITWEGRSKKDDNKLPHWFDKDFKIEEDEYDKLAEQYTRGYLET